MRAIATRPGTPDSIHLRLGARYVSTTETDLPALADRDGPFVGSAAAAWDDYAGAVATIGRAEANEATRGWLDELLPDRIEGFDAEAIARHLAGAGAHIKTTVEIGAG